MKIIVVKFALTFIVHDDIISVNYHLFLFVPIKNDILSIFL